jgi:transcriptional regulator with XRE-family HTH domain
MARRKRSALTIQSQREARALALRLAPDVARSRRRSRLTQEALARRIGISASRYGQIERGEGAEAPLSTWVALGVALGRPLRVEFARDRDEEVADTGHLRMQELMLRLGRQLGYRRTFELHTKPSDPNRSADVGWRNDERRVLILQECWNAFGDVGAASRATARKVAEAEAYAISIAGDGRAYRVRSVWIVRATRHNRALVEKYPEVFAARFPGSSHRWVKALTEGTEPPDGPGLVWCDVAATRLFAWRRTVAR